jgi:hypothetical protein
MYFLLNAEGRRHGQAASMPRKRDGHGRASLFCVLGAGCSAEPSAAPDRAAILVSKVRRLTGGPGS